MTWRTIPAFCVASMMLASASLGQEKDPWIGKRVFTQFGTVLKVGNDVLDDQGRTASIETSGHDRNISRIYRVEHKKGEWLWLKDENSLVAGWVQTRYVIPYEQAIDYFTTQIRANPQASIYNRRGLVWREKGEHDIAIADYNEAIRIDPGEATYWSNRGACWAVKKVHDKAIADYSEAIRLNPKWVAVYNNRGDAWFAKKDYGKALADYNEAIRLDSKDALAYGNRAWIWATCPDHKYRDGSRAVESATRACELSGWKNAYNHSKLAAAYAELGDFDKALEWQEKAHKVYSEVDRKEWGKLLVLFREKKPYRDKD